MVVCEIGAYFGDDTYSIFADYGDNGSLHNNQLLMVWRQSYRFFYKNSSIECTILQSAWIKIYKAVA
jgi:hypothetical protein